MGDLESIEKYINGELNEAEKLTFEDKLQQDKDLQKEVKLHKAMMHGIKGFFEEKLLEDFKEWDKEIPKAEQKSKQVFLRPLLAIAATVLLLALVYIGVNYTQPLDNQVVFKEYYQAYPNYASNTVRGENEDKDNYQKAFTLYSEGKFKEAIILFKDMKVKVDEDIYHEVNFYWALCYLELDELEQAKNKLAFHVLKSNPHDYTNPARWYLALTYLKMNEIEQCKTELSYLTKKQTDYTQKAENLLSRLP